MKALFLTFLLFMGCMSQLNENDISDVMASLTSISSKSVYGSARYEIVFNLVGGRVGQVVSKPVYLAGNATMTCIYIDTSIPVDNTTYPTKDFGLYNTTSGKVNALGLTVNHTVGLGGESMFCVSTSLTSSGHYYAIYRLTSYASATGTNTTQDACGVYGGDNTTCCANTECNGRGTCSGTVLGCICDPGYTGNFCQTIDLGSGTCVNGTFNSTAGACDCDDGFTGTDCSIPTCSSNGYWSETASACRCIEGWGGDICDVCRTSPLSDETLTYVCFRTGNQFKPYVLSAFSTSNLKIFSGGYVQPGSTTRDGTVLDCACNVETSQTQAETANLNQHKGKHPKKKNSHSKATSVVSNALQSDASFKDSVFVLLDDLGAFTSQEKAVFYGQLVEYIVGRDIAKSDSSLLIAFLMIMLGVSITFFTMTVYQKLKEPSKPIAQLWKNN